MNAVNMLNWAPRVGICVGSFFLRERLFFFSFDFFGFSFGWILAKKKRSLFGNCFARILMDKELWSHIRRFLSDCLMTSTVPERIKIKREIVWCVQYWMLYERMLQYLMVKRKDENKTQVD